MNTLTEVINKGVPVETPITLSTNDILKICENKSRLESIIKRNFEKYMEFLKTKTPTEDIEIFNTLGIITDKNSLEKKFCFAPSGFAASIFVNLNVDNVCRTQEIEAPIMSFTQEELEKYIQEKANPRLEKLAQVRSEKELRKEFPAIHIKYKEQDRLVRQIAQSLKTLKKSKTSILTKLEVNKQLIDSLNILGIKNEEELQKSGGILSIENFCTRYRTCLQGLVDNTEEIINYIVTHPINLNQLSQEDSEKLSLYVANQFLRTCEMVEEKDKQRYLYLITTYFNENSKRKTDDKTSIVIGKVENGAIGLKTKGHIITPKRVYERYKKLVIENPELHVVDFDTIDFSGMSLQQVEEFMIEYMKDLKANWEIIPNSQMKDKLPTYAPKTSSNLSEEEKERRQQKLLDLYIDKKEFYDSTDPFFRIVGKNTFEGYVGHIYTNGTVVLDKFFENQQTGRVANGEAIYVMNISDFYRLSNLPKQELIYNPNCKRIYHSGDWKERVKEKIEGTTTTKTAEELKCLIKSGKVGE